MAEEFLPITVFRQREIDETRVEGMGNKDKPKWVLSGADLHEHAQSLIAGLSDAYEGVLHNEGLPYVYDVKLNERDTSKTKRKPIVDMLNVDGANGDANVIGMRGANSLIVRAKDAGQVRAMEERLSDKERYDLPLTCIESISRFVPEIKSTPDETVYKARLLDFGPDAALCERVFEDQLSALCIAFQKVSYAQDLNVYRLEANQSQVKMIADGVASETLFFIRPMPRCVATLDGMPSVGAPDPMEPDLSMEYPVVGVLDSGIAPICQLQPWLMEKRLSTYTDNELDKQHGTFVAGVITYGDRFEHSEWVGGLPPKLLDGAVFPADGNVDESTMVDSIRTIVGATRNRVKVWNLSLSFMDEVSDNEFSEFGMALDAIQDDHGVLICKSAGNCDVRANGTKGRLCVGSDSVRALTVGSAAQVKAPLDQAGVGEASPFSRKGPGPQYIIKPEVSHYGGNVGRTPTGYVRSEVHSFDVRGNPAGAVGTSFSTPRVSALAANLQLALAGEFDPLLIKALIVHSTSFPGDSLIPNTEKVEEMGFGIPANLRSILSDEEHSSTLVLHGFLLRGQKIEINDFPMPSSLVRDGYYTGQVILTAAFSPIREPKEAAEYCQSDIEVKLGTYDHKELRDITKQGILNPIGRKDNKNLLNPSRYSRPKLRSAEDEFSRREKMLIRYKGKYAPVKKYALDLADLTKRNREAVRADRLWYLDMKGTYRDSVERRALQTNEPLRQEYCVIITIRDPNGLAPVYNEVPQLLEHKNFWHQNVQLANQVRAMVGQ